MAKYLESWCILKVERSMCCMHIYLTSRVIQVILFWYMCVCGRIAKLRSDCWRKLQENRTNIGSVALSECCTLSSFIIFWFLISKWACYYTNNIRFLFWEVIGAQVHFDMWVLIDSARFAWSLLLLYSTVSFCFRDLWNKRIRSFSQEKHRRGWSCIPKTT